MDSSGEQASPEQVWLLKEMARFGEKFPSQGLVPSYVLQLGVAMRHGSQCLEKICCFHTE